MKNPFGDQPLPEFSDSYHTIKKRIYKKVSAKVNDRIRLMLQNSYEHALSEENFALSRPERKRLYAEIVAMVMGDMTKDLGKP
jgi:hypothetical protein